MRNVQSSRYSLRFSCFPGPALNLFSAENSQFLDPQERRPPPPIFRKLSNIKRLIGAPPRTLRP